MGWTFFQFNRAFDAATGIYARVVSGLLRVSLLVLAIYGGLLVLTYWGFTRTPTGFIPAQDKGYLLVNVQLPDSSSLERTEAVMKHVEEVTGKLPGVTHTLAIAGQSILMNANAPNFGAMYVMLDDFHHRAEHRADRPGASPPGPASASGRDQGRAGQRLRGPPGRRPGNRRRVQDRGRGPRRPGLRGDRGRRQPDRRRGLAPIPSSQGLFTSFRANTPWLFLDIDREKAKLLGVSIAELFNTLQVYLGSLYVNDFNRFGRTWQVNVQGDADFRKQIDDLSRLAGPQRTGGHGPPGHAGRRSATSAAR